MKTLLAVAAACVALSIASTASADPYMVYSPFGPQPLSVYYPPAVMAPAAPVYVEPALPAPVVTYYPSYPAVTTYYAPTPVYAPAPVVYGRPVWVRPKVYVGGQPLRNTLRAVTP